MRHPWLSSHAVPDVDLNVTGALIRAWARVSARVRAARFTAVRAARLTCRSCRRYASAEDKPES
jgi:hypothetical protein